MALPARGARRRDGARALRPAGAALHGRAASLPALAACRATTPERNLAGVLYLFLRGMTGADTPAVDGTPCGVFAWRPPGALVEALSDVLDRGVRGVTTVDPFDARRALGAPGLLRRVQRRRRARAGRRARRAAARRAGRRGRRAGCCSPRRSPSAVRGSVTCTSTSRRSATRATVDAEEPVDLTRAAVAGCGRVAGAAGGQRAGRGGRGRRRRGPLRLVGTSLYLDRYWREERRIAADLRALRDEPAGGRARRSARRRARAPVRRADGRAASDWPPRPRCGAASRSSPAARAPARRRPSRGSSRCCSSRRRPRAAPRRRSSRSRRRPARRRRGSSRRCTRRRPTLAVSDDVRDRLLALDASTLHRLLGWRPGSAQPLPPRPRQPAAARRRDRRRDLDGARCR